MSRWAVLAATLAAAPSALAQDAGAGRDASSSTGDGGSAGSGVIALCPGATQSGTAAVAFERSGPVDFGPGTGMRMAGSRSSVGIEYNLLFSGTYLARMRGNLNVRWPRPLTFSAEGTPMGGLFDVTFGLRMTATIYVLGIAFPLPLTGIIDDNVDHGSATFTPWAWNYEGTDVHLNVSAWRTLYRRTVTIGGEDYPIELMARYNMNARLRTVEIGFPDPNNPNAMAPPLGTITGSMPETVLAPPRDGSLDLLTRWKPEIEYSGRVEFRLVVGRDVCVGPCPLCTCTTIDFASPEFEFVQTSQSLPDPYDQQPHFDFPAHTLDRPEIDFGEVRIGETVTDSLRITNVGRALLAARAMPLSNPAFSAENPVCVTPGSTEPLSVSFTPPREGTFTTELTLDTNSTRGAEVVVIRGVGTTGPTRPPVRADGGASGDGGIGGRSDSGYRTLVGEATCACRTVGGGAATGRSSRAGVALFAGLVGLAVARRRRRDRGE